MKYRYMLPACLVIAVSCDDTTGPRNSCNSVALPLRGSANGPEVAAVSLEVQSSGIILHATATDPQGTDDLLDVNQMISVFANAECTGTPILMQDDLVGSGIEETFGTVVAASDNPGLYSAIEAAPSWPVSVDFRDRDGNRTTGRVMATVIRAPHRGFPAAVRLSPAIAQVVSCSVA